MKKLILIFIVFLFTKGFPSDSLYIFPSGRDIDISVNANVEKIGLNFVYNFEVVSGLNSIQNVSEFFVEFNASLDSIISPLYWLAGISSVWTNILMWGSRDSLYDISPGNSLSGFGYLSEGLPSIRRCYGVGYFELPSFEEGEEPDDSEIVGDGILENSVQVYTISASTIPDPFIQLEFLDTLISYTDSSYALGWIQNQETRDKYNTHFDNASNYLEQGDSSAARNKLQIVLNECNSDSSTVLTSEAYALLRYNTEYLIEQLPSGGESISTYSIFATNSIWLKQNSSILSGSVGVNEIGEPPFLTSQVELAVGKSTTTPAGYTLKGNRIEVKQNTTVNADVYYNELTNNGTITGSLNTPLELPLITALPEFYTSTPGTEDIVVSQNEEHTLLPGAYGDIQVKNNGKLIFTGGEYHINNFTGGQSNQLLFQSESEVRIKEKFETGKGSYIGPEDTTTMSAKDIVFYVEGINGNNDNLGATPKAAKVGLDNTVKANFYAPNGTIWLRQNSEVEGAFIGKNVIVGLSVQVKLKSAF